MVRFPDSETDDDGVVHHKAKRGNNGYREAQWQPSVGNVFEGPIVGALVAVFAQLADMGAKRAGDQ